MWCASRTRQQQIAEAREAEGHCMQAKDVTWEDMSSPECNRGRLGGRMFLEPAPETVSSAPHSPSFFLSKTIAQQEVHIAAHDVARSLPLRSVTPLSWMLSGQTMHVESVSSTTLGQAIPASKNRISREATDVRSRGNHLYVMALAVLIRMTGEFQAHRKPIHSEFCCLSRYIADIPSFAP